ncbi:asparagine synthase (glutamine-hydrolyzing) [Kribbella aluminosa]|uniref:asparagine synthase (glutamine-hydrolyzing) n=1 Tax=Kribbella aluminosa TaxID=416017 RepID=A0ABS4UYZ7_9ACTN|nr:asparagine synthase (glutamine-hydrolyzing) [Kribbella aluminosa]MBP2356885.1 asparagine synthase (glutamine-hydrolyzing) [Kribbella aluminosa]
MCGIAGCYQQRDGFALAEAMSDRIAHRGPDADRVYAFDQGDVRAFLAHRRLSIIDLSAAADQPFSKRGLTICYNGELYNYKELRAELSKSGVHFRTQSDTEVVLEAWRRWGPEALGRFRGMFAFAMLDEESGSLYLARDPLGIKPLYFLRRQGGVIFASELKALVSAVGSELRTEPGALIASMLYYWLPEQRCAIDGVDKLPPGSWAEFRPDGSSRHETYWRVSEVATEAAAGPPADLRQVIEESVAAHLVADVGVSTFLSGGLDSSLVTVLAKQLDPGIDSYTITFRAQDQKLEAMPDDAVYARKLARQFGIDLHEIEIAPDVVELLPRIVDNLDEPIGDPAAINTLLMCETARDAGVKVLLSGMGADELFGGYRKHLACVMGAQYQRLPGVLRNGLVGPAVRRLPVTVNGRGLRYARWAKRFETFANLPEEEAFRRSYTMYDADQLAGLISPDLEPYVGKLLAEHSDIYHDNALDDHVNRMCLADSRMFLPGLNLTYTDRASMAASTEVRTPFVDPVVARAAFSIPGSDKIHRRVGKLALKKAAEAWLPKEIIYRPKASFSAPLRAWVRNDLRELVDDVLLRGELVGSGFLRQSAVQQIVDDERSGREDYSKQIWQLLTLETWTRHMRSLGVTITSG